MIRRLTFFAALLGAALLPSLPAGAAGEVLLDQAPNSSDTLLLLDAAALRGSGLYRELNRAAGSLLGDFADFETRYQLPAERIGRVLWADSTRSKRERGVLLETTLPEAELLEKLKAYELRSEPRPGGVTHYFKTPSSLPEARVEVALTYLAPGVVLLGEAREFQVFQTARAAGRGASPARAPLARLPETAQLRLAMLPAPPDPEKKKRNSLLSKQIRQLTLSARLTGREDLGLVAEALAECRDEKGAAAQLRSLNNFRLLFGGLFFANDPELGTTVDKSFEFRQEGTTVRGRAELPEPLMRRFLNYVAQELARGNQPAAE